MLLTCPIISGLQIDAMDNSGQKPLITHDKPPAFRNPGLRTVNYFAKDSSDNQAVCTFYVNISGKIICHFLITLQELKLQGIKIRDGVVFSRYSRAQCFMNHPSFLPIKQLALWLSGRVSGL